MREYVTLKIGVIPTVQEEGTTFFLPNSDAILKVGETTTLHFPLEGYANGVDIHIIVARHEVQEGEQV